MGKDVGFHVFSGNCSGLKSDNQESHLVIINIKVDAQISNLVSAKEKNEVRRRYSVFEFGNSFNRLV